MSPGSQATSTDSPATSTAPLSYTSLSPGQGVTWETRPDGIIIRITAPPIDARDNHLIQPLIIFPILALELFLCSRMHFYFIPTIATLAVTYFVLNYFIGHYLLPLLPRWPWRKRPLYPLQPIVLEVRSGLLFIHDRAHPVAFPKIWDYVLESEMANLHLVAELLRPWLIAAKDGIPSWSPDFKAPSEYFHPSRHPAPPPIQFETAPSSSTSHDASLTIRVTASPLPTWHWVEPEIVGCLLGVLFLALVGFVVAAMAGYISWRGYGTSPPTWIPIAFPFYFGALLIVALVSFFRQLSKTQKQRIEATAPPELVIEIRHNTLHCHNPHGRARNRDIALPLADIANIRGLHNPKASHQCGRLMVDLKNGRSIELVTHQRVDDLRQIMGRIRKHLPPSSPAASDHLN